MNIPSTRIPALSRGRDLAKRVIWYFNQDPGARINLVLGILGWVYVIGLYWTGGGLGAELPAYARY